MITDGLEVATKNSNDAPYQEFALGSFEHFTLQDAHLILHAAQLTCGSGQRPLLAFYPLSSKKWESLATPSWTTVANVEFRRRGLVGSNPVQWAIGFDSDANSFATILEWAWRSSMCETLLILVGVPEDAPKAVENFQDDWGDADVNEQSLLAHFDPIFSRTHEGNHLRISSRKLMEKDIRGLFDSATAQIEDYE